MDTCELLCGFPGVSGRVHARGCRRREPTPLSERGDNLGYVLGALYRLHNYCDDQGVVFGAGCAGTDGVTGDSRAPSTGEAL
jgi:hypothetical protein